MPNFMPVVRLIVTALNWRMVQINAGNLLTHRIAAVFNVQNSRKTPQLSHGDIWYLLLPYNIHVPNIYPSILFFIFGYKKAWAQARAQGFRPCTQGSGSGLENLKPEPAQAEPKPGHSGRAGPATSLEATPRNNSSKFTDRQIPPGNFTICIPIAARIP
ncbi:hypothetical protein B0H16DRAFT_1455853 [Mycena metata]|uniref:Uncharacterized protein n=1 Tax=Mycena metata TaxID=1033252 RepID=A0AAD7JDQ7_9AGAR|nr:hypothetical protein B0H16DRAFT_1455853 [Mycena metata]